MVMETMTSDWPVIGNPQPPINQNSTAQDWEMIISEEDDTISNNNNNNHVVILPSETSTEVAAVSKKMGRPRSATIGGELVAESGELNNNDTRSMTSHSSSSKMSLSRSSLGSPRRLRRCASTPDLMVGDSAHEVIVEDESDSDEDDDSDVELIEAEAENEESFEVLEGEDDDDQPVIIDDEEENDLDSGVHVSTPSVTSSWTMATPPPKSNSAWGSGMNKSPSFADILAKNIDKTPDGEFGKDKAATEAKLRDSHRRHHLRVRTKPKFVVVSDEGGGGGGSAKKMMKHAHSTGDLTRMLSDVQEGHESSGDGHHYHQSGGRNRRAKKQLSAMLEEDEEGADFIIGRGNGTTSCGGGGGDEILGDTDAMDYYHRKNHGSKSNSNKKKERPDEAKRREIIMHKKDLQRKKQAASQKSTDASGGSGGGKKKKNEKGFGGKKERRRL